MVISEIESTGFSVFQMIWTMARWTGRQSVGRVAPIAMVGIYNYVYIYIIINIIIYIYIWTQYRCHHFHVRMIKMIKTHSNLPCFLVGGIPTPQKNMSSPVGMMTFPTEWKNNIIFQTTNHIQYFQLELPSPASL